MSNVDNYGYASNTQGVNGQAPPGPPPNYGGNDGYYGQQSGISQPQGAHFK